MTISPEILKTSERGEKEYFESLSFRLIISTELSELLNISKLLNISSHKT